MTGSILAYRPLSPRIRPSFIVRSSVWYRLRTLSSGPAASTSVGAAKIATVRDAAMSATNCLCPFMPISSDEDLWDACDFAVRSNGPAQPREMPFNYRCYSLALLSVFCRRPAARREGMTGERDHASGLDRTW